MLILDNNLYILDKIIEKRVHACSRWYNMQKVSQGGAKIKRIWFQIDWIMMKAYVSILENI